jgi:two-component system sensor histidine kinase PilS (NtrC family)
MIVASGSFILYGLLVNLLYHDIVRLPDSFIFEKQVKTADVYYNLFVSFIGFYVVAYLSSLITEKLRQTDRSLKEASGNLEELLLFHENIITSITTGLITTNMDNSITSLNRAAEELLGLSFSEVNGRDILDLFPPGGRINKSFRAGGQGFGVESYFEIEVPQGKDNHKYLGVTVSDFYDRQDRLLGHIYLFQDLTEVKKLEHEIKIKERMATVGEMAATIAHEIRNPLASMSGCIQMLRGQTTSGSQDEALMNIFIRESDRLNRIIEDFLIYARPSPTIPSWISLDQLLQDTCTLLQHSSELHENHEVKLNIDGQSHFQYYADPDQMKQVFWNLARNALQAMPQGGVLEISLRKDSSGRLILVFRDEGTGIEDEQVHKIFQPFHARYKEGAGLGLAIVYRIIHEHKGDIYVSSAPKAGTTLTIILPPVSEN